LKISSQEVGNRSDAGGTPKNGSSDPPQECTPLQQPNIRPVAGDQVGRGMAVSEPPAGEPPVRMNDMGAQAMHRSADCPVESQEKSRESERRHRRAEGALVQASGVRDSFTPVGGVAEAVHSNGPDLLLGRGTRGMGGNHLDLVTSLSDTLGDASHEGASRVTSKTGVIVGDGENPQRFIW
jgi:hypothetical protein